MEPLAFDLRGTPSGCARRPARRWVGGGAPGAAARAAGSAGTGAGRELGGFFLELGQHGLHRDELVIENRAGDVEEAKDFGIANGIKDVQAGLARMQEIA